MMTTGVDGWMDRAPTVRGWEITVKQQQQPGHVQALLRLVRARGRTCGAGLLAILAVDGQFLPPRRH